MPETPPLQLFDLQAERDKIRRLKDTVDSGGGPPDDPGMQERVEKLEKLVEKTVERVVNIERDVAVMRSNYATGKEVSEAKSSIIMWVVGAIFVAQLLPMVRDFVRPAVSPAPSSAPPAPAAAPAQTAK